MKLVILVLALLSSALGQSATSSKDDSDRLRIELRAKAAQVRMSDDVVLTVFFRSSEKKITIWSALGWSAAVGLYLQVFDSSGHEVPISFGPIYDPMPPDLSGKSALITVAGQTFAGFDSQIPANMLFPKPGTYTLRCRYSPPLSRHYFQGHTIWGKEDGAIESAGVPIVVTQ